MNIKIHRGENQIGGNIIEIATETTKILLDAGLDLDDEKNKTLPHIDGLFDYAGYDGIFISHYHSDHMGLLYNVNGEIPVYIGQASYKIIKASDDYKKQRTISPKGFLKHKEQIVIGDITVTPYLCDHSAFDSYMLLCQAQGESVLYTGDFRSNGRKSFERLLTALPEKVDTLLCEGTTLSRENYQPLMEIDLEERATTLFNEAKGPIFVLQSSMNIDRIVTMYRAAKKSNRIFLEELYMADIASAAGENIPNPRFDDVFAFITSPLKFNGLKKYKHRVGKNFIAKSRFVMCVRNSMLSYLKSLNKKMSFENGLLIYSFWEGYREQENMQKFLKQCEEMGLKIVSLHTSGHADGNTIKKLIDRVNPEKVIPIHTESAEKFKEIVKDRLLK